MAQAGGMPRSPDDSQTERPTATEAQQDAEVGRASRAGLPILQESAVEEEGEDEDAEDDDGVHRGSPMGETKARGLSLHTSHLIHTKGIWS